MSTRIYIGRLNREVRERDLERFFRGYGRIREILIKNGFGFVEFEDFQDADDAVYELNGRDLLGDRVTIEHARGSPRGNDMYRDRNRGYRNNPMQRRRGQGGGGGGGGGRDKYGPPTRTEHRLIVENLSSRVSWQDLKDYMRQAGEVTYADAHKQRRNEGVVEFASYSDMKNAVDKLDDTDLSGRRIKLVEDKSRSRRRSRSRSKSKSLSYSPVSRRSRSRNKSRSKSASYSRSRSKSRSRNKSLSMSKSRSRSKSPNNKARSSRSLSRKRSHSRSRSASDDRRDRKSRSRSKSHKSASRSRSKSYEKRSRSPTPVQKDDDISNSADDKN